MSIGLALSGGGFRATLFHLGVIRYLRDTRRLEDVSHICSVSGGSVLAAHLVLNWEAYTGAQEQFEKVERELLNCTKRDIRGRILRRLPFLILKRLIPKRLRTFLHLPVSRVEQFRAELDSQLFHRRLMHLLPEEPSIQMLATNMKDGQLCSFTREGLLLKNGEEHSLIKNVNTSISLAVSASAAFPGMFPPALIEAELIGVHRGELPATGPPILTDGGVFDNLAIRRLTQVAEEIEHTGGDGRSLTHLIVSDAGGAFNDRWFTKMTGLVGTALRAADILMKRIHEMERERIDRRGEPELASPALVRLDIADICPVSASDGGMPEAAQMHMKYIRTDLDRFSRSEREALVSHGYAISHKMLTPIFTMSPDIAANIRIPICQQSPDKLVRSLQGSQNRKVRAVSYRDWILVPQILLCTVILWAGWILNPLVNRQTIHISGQQRLESTLLVEIMAQVLESASPDFEVHRDIDEPEDLFTNLLLNKTQLYPGYPGAVQDQLSAIRKEKSSGTGAKELGNVSQLNDLLRQDEPGGHLRALEPFGFESRFVFVMMRDHVWLGQTLGTGNSQPTLTKLVLSCVS